MDAQIGYGKPVGLPAQGGIQRERPICVAENQIHAALSSLRGSIDRLKNSFEPVLRCESPETARPVPPKSESHFDNMVAETVSSLENYAREINDICDRSAI